MHDVLKVNMMANIHDENDHIAAHTNEDLSEQHIYVVNVMGAPGVGKTTTLKNLIRNLKGLKPYVIEGDIESDIDTKDLRDWESIRFRSIPSALVIWTRPWSTTWYRT
jgi:hydrogenase nickel incorporation protein HypB